MKRTSVLSLFLALSLLPSIFAEEEYSTPNLKILSKGDTVLFLGDSITQGGQYIAYFETFLYHRGLSQDFTILNLGLGSETASGLSEKTHPFPRPCIHTRIDRILPATTPDVTFVCYGMNDGIFHPSSPARLRAYQEGITELIQKLRDANSKIVLLTPPPFDAQTALLKGKQLAPASAPDFSYRAPYENYDQVLKEFGTWIKEQKSSVDLVIDIHTPLTQWIREERSKDKNFLSGDSIHPNQRGHLVMANAILKALSGSSPLLNEKGETPSYLNALYEKVLPRSKLLSSSWREHIGHEKPGKRSAMPLPEAQEKAHHMDEAIRESLSSL